MSNIVVPTLGESVVEARVARWLKKAGDRVEVGEPVVELETEKIDLEVSAEKSGVIASIARQEGEDVKIGELLAVVDENGTAAAAAPASAAPAPSPSASSCSRDRPRRGPECPLGTAPGVTVVAYPPPTLQRGVGAARGVGSTTRRCQGHLVGVGHRTRPPLSPLSHRQ